MSSIKFIQHKFIDFQKWDDCIAACTNAQVYGFSWYLNAITQNCWHALVLNDYEAVFPLPFQYKLGIIPVVYQPFFCQQLGLFQKEGINFNYEDFIKAIPRQYVKVYLHLRQANEVKLNYKKRTNYLLHLNKTYAELKNNYSADCLKNIRKAQTLPLQIDFNTDYLSAIELYKATWGVNNKVLKPMHYQIFANACSNALKNNCIICVHISQNENILARAILLKNQFFLHYVCAAPTPEGKKAGIMHTLIDSIIQKFCGTNLTFDFEGSEIDSVASFYRKFSPEQSFYYAFGRKLF
jgi:hypothetical protein